MLELDTDILDSETIVRGICSPYHFDKGKVKPAAFEPSPETEDVSVMRCDWMGVDECRKKAKELENTTINPPKIYAGLAVISAQQIRKGGANIVDSREHYLGHADIKMGIILPQKGVPLAPDKRYKLNQIKKYLAGKAAYFADPDPKAEKWCGSQLAANTCV